MFRAGPLMNVLLNYTQTLIAQVAQAAMCNRYHSIEQQLCRRLLVGLDYSATQELRLTQELVASLLGVRREGVTAAALRLQEAGVIRYSRGLISVLDRRRLELRACECYAVTRRSFGYREPEPLAA
jgi:CRP-like cAMP-binding protein